MIFSFKVEVKGDGIEDLANIASNIEAQWPELRDEKLRRIVYYPTDLGFEISKNFSDYLKKPGRAA